MKPKPPTIELWPIDKPIPYGNNPRKIDHEAVVAVAGSLAAFGFQSPIIVDKNGVIINGHTRLLAAKYIDLKEVPVIVAKDLTPTQVQAFRIADNRTGEFSEWDFDKLMKELEATTEIDMSWMKPEEMIADSDLVDDRREEPPERGQQELKFSVVVSCRDEQHQDELFKKLTKAKERCEKKFT